MNGKTNQQKTHKQQSVKKQYGLALFELLLVLSVLSTIAALAVKTTIAKNVIEKIKDDANLAKYEVEQIFDAASGYIVDLDQWPDFSGACSNAITTLATTTPTAYLRNINNLSLSPYNTTYHASCDATTFTIVIETLDADQALVLFNKLANASVSDTVVTVSIPRPEEQPTLTQFLMLDGSRAMTGDLDTGSNTIKFNGQDIKLGIGKFVSMGSETFNSITATINKPNCSQDTLNGTPKIILRIHGITTIAEAATAVTGVSWSALFNNLSATQWQLSTTGLSAITGVAETFCDYGAWNR